MCWNGLKTRAVEQIRNVRESRFVIPISRVPKSHCRDFLLDDFTNYAAACAFETGRGEKRVAHKVRQKLKS